MTEELLPWPWRARPRAKTADPITVMATTYLGALIAAARRYGFVKRRYDGEEEFDLSKVECRVVYEWEMVRVEAAQ